MLGLRRVPFPFGAVRPVRLAADGREGDVGRVPSGDSGGSTVRTAGAVREDRECSQSLSRKVSEPPSGGDRT